MQEAKILFEKLKIVSLLDLALTTPSSYSNNSISKKLIVGEVQTFEAEVINVNSNSGRMYVVFNLPKLGIELKSVFFQVTTYHYDTFKIGTHHYIQGKITSYRGDMQMIQPKSIQYIGEIIPKYSTAISDYQMRELIKLYITEENLYNEGLNRDEVSFLIKVHYPKSLEDINQSNIEILKFIEAFNHLKKLKGKRVNFPALESLDGNIDSFIKNLPFKLTKDQNRVISQIQKDLKNKKKAVKRIVIGDVGSGKTIIILASAVMAYPHKSILMAPTSLLAMQIYEEATKFLPKYMKIALVKQRESKGDYLSADFIIGTHALLYKDDIPKAPLIMVDEQHRFGTKQRAKLEQIVAKGKIKPHFLQFSATPIPRTQAMMESELIDMSLITTTPFKKDITTEVIDRSDFSRLFKEIQSEISKNNQVLIVYPLVEESYSIAYQSIDEGRGFWEKRFKNVFVTHGKDKRKEEVLVEFREKGDILLATTVIEVGISLPRLTLIVVVGAERLGLATLHQLRGRVGRLGLKSWCYLFTNDKSNGRLHSFSKTLSGFEIAKLDLKFRKSGDILDGTMQSGLQFKWLDLAEDENIVKLAKERLHSLVNYPTLKGEA